MEYAPVIVLSVLVFLNLALTSYLFFRYGMTVSGPFIHALGQKEAELLILRNTVQQAGDTIKKLYAENQSLKEAQEAPPVAKAS